MQIKELREKIGLSQKELANKSGISISSIRAYEQGTRCLYNMEIKNAVALATALGEEPLKFYSDIVSMFPY